MFTKTVGVTALVIIALFAYGCKGGKEAPKTSGGESRVVAIVGDRKITLHDINVQIKQHKSGVIHDQAESAETLVKLRKALLSRLIDDTILEAEADRQGITIDKEQLENQVRLLLGDYDESRLGLMLAGQDMTFDDWKAALAKNLKIKKLTQSLDARIAVSDAEVKDFFQKNVDEFKVEERVRVMQIMVNDETTAEQIRKKLVGKADFTKLARQYSQSPDAADGGDMGFFGRGQMPQEFEDAVFRLREGDISDVVKSMYGFHIFKVVKTEKPRPMTFEEARDRIHELLLSQKREEEFKSWLENVKKGVTIKTFPEALSDLPR